MKIKKQTSKKVKLFIVTISILSVLTAVGAFIFFKMSNQAENTTQTVPPATDEQIINGGIIKEKSLNPPAEKEEDTTRNLDTDSSKIDVIISASGKTDSLVQIRALIQKLVTSGSCTLTLSKDQISIVRTANVQALSSSSTCSGFDIPLDDLSSGVWQISLKVTTENSSGEALGTIEV